VAVVGAGPAGLAAAHRLAMLGHDVEIFEALPKSGGLNEYGIAAYKLPNGIAQDEVDFILSIGGITVHNNKALGRDIALAELNDKYDAVFVGTGLGAVRALGFENENIKGVFNAVDYIAKLRQSDTKTDLEIGRKVVVIGGGNTAIDMAVQAKRLGAEDVTLVYRRGPEDMTATHHEQDYAKINGVTVKHYAKPVALIEDGGAVSGVTFEYTSKGADGSLNGTGETFDLAADMVFKAIGQVFIPDPATQSAVSLEIQDSRIVVNDDRATTVPGIFAGGDCILGGEDLTVAAVQDGKVAAHSIDRFLK
jgi:dihydropyrimidine dehydrogenase (NAD+) subunit PreT